MCCIFRSGDRKSAVQTFHFRLPLRRRLSAPAKSEAVATVKLNDVDDAKESQPASASREHRPFCIGPLDGVRKVGDDGEAAQHPAQRRSMPRRSCISVRFYEAGVRRCVAGPKSDGSWPARKVTDLSLYFSPWRNTSAYSAAA